MGPDELVGATRCLSSESLVTGILTMPRILLPLFEVHQVHQQPDGSVRIPAAVRPYMGGQEYIRPPQVLF